VPSAWDGGWGHDYHSDQWTRETEPMWPQVCRQKVMEAGNREVSCEYVLAILSTLSILSAVSHPMHPVLAPCGGQGKNLQE
jgi:hypothetical protein